MTRHQLPNRRAHEAIRAAFTRESDGHPAGIVGCLRRPSYPHRACLLESPCRPSCAP